MAARRCTWKACGFILIMAGALGIGVGTLIHDGPPEKERFAQLFEELVAYYRDGPQDVPGGGLLDRMWLDVKPLRPAIDKIRPKVRRAADILLSLQNAEPKDLRMVRQQLDHRDPVRRMAALVVLTRMRDRQAVRSVVPLLDDRDILVKTCAIRCLALIRGDAAEDALIRKLKDRGESAVLEFMPDYGPGKPWSGKLWPIRVPARAYVAWCLGHCGDSKVMRALTEAAEDEDPLVARAAREAMARAGDPTMQRDPSASSADGNEARDHPTR